MRNINRNGLVDSYECITPNSRGRGYQTSTPSAYDAPRAIHTCIDIPSQVSGMNETNIYTNPNLQNYNAGGFGAPYNQTNNAQITYYINKNRQSPFVSPNFLSNAHIQYENYIDPMGSWKPHYTYKLAENVSNLSWIADSTFHRTDLMSRQMSKMNQVRSEPFL